MSDTNLDPSITALTNRASTVAVTATARELMNISRLAPSLEQSENTDLEIAINARAEDLAPSATATELKSIGKAIGNVLEPETFVAGGTLPNQAQNSGNFLATNGTAESWGGLSVSTLSEVNISSIMNDETLVYNHVNGLFENNSQVFRIQEIGLTENIPASGAFGGQVVFDQQTSELKYWDGSEWKVAAVVAAGGGSTSQVDWQSVNTTFVHRVQSLGDSRWGNSAAISGDYFCIADSENAGSYRGTLYIYDTETATLQHSVTGTVSNGQQGVDYEGHGPTAMSGDYIAISSGYHMNQDRVRIIQASTGNVVATITRPSELANDCRFGQSVALNEDCSKLVVGAPRNLSNRGRVYVYDISDKNNLPSADEYTLSLQSYTQNPSYKFGESVAISGNILVTASPGMYQGVGLENRGSVFDATTGDMIPSGVGDSKFVQPSGYTAPFGHSVDVFENSGDFIAAFCEREAIVSGEANAGAVHIYNSSGDLIRTIVTPNASQNEYFGTQAKILSSDTIMISAPTADTGGEFSSFPHRRGRVYFYSITDGSLLATLDNPDDLSSSANHNHNKYFGRSISADKTTGKILVAQGPGALDHRAYIFEAPVTQSGGGSGASSIDWSAADSTIATIGGTDIGHTLTSTQLSDGRNIVIAGFDHNSFYAYDLADNSLIWNVSSAGSVPDDNGAMASSGDYFAAIEGGSVRVRSALDGSYADGGSSLLSIPGWGSNQVQSISMHGNYIFLPRTAYNQYAMVKWDTREIVWQYTDTNHPWNIVNSNPNAGIAAYNHDMGENYLAVQDMYSHSGAYQAGAVHIIDYLTGQEVSRLDDPNPVVNGRFGGISGRENGIAVSGDKAIIGDPNDGHGKVHIFDMPTGTLEFTIDENTAGGSGIAYYDRQSTAGYNFGQEIEAYGDYAVVSHNWDSYIIQISTGEIKHETALLNIDRVTMVENYAIGGDLNTNNLRIIKGIIS
tara:strand:+ start:8478 stop:11369 length:2892 start_codon:yes stop_codon:yes gene_type:complete